MRRAGESRTGRVPKNCRHVKKRKADDVAAAAFRLGLFSGGIRRPDVFNVAIQGSVFILRSFGERHCPPFMGTRALQESIIRS
jgi:hypothetical protein